MKALLDKGADPNARLKKKVWYSGYNFDLSGVDETGATPFWRAAYASDVDAMKLLVAYGADPNIRTKRSPAARAPATSIATCVDVSGLPPVPVGGPGVTPLQAAAGVGYGEGLRRQLAPLRAGRHAGGGQVSGRGTARRRQRRDHEGNTALHHAAARGDNEMIQYLVSKGADVKAVDPRGPDDRRHGQRPGAAHPAVPGDDRAAREARREEQPQVRILLIGETLES